MKSTWIVPVVVALCAAVVSAQSGPAFKDSRERISYALGLEAGQQIRTRAIDVDVDAFARGMKAGIGASASLMSDQQMRDAIAMLQTELKRREFEARSARAAGNRQAAAEFLEENKKQEGVVTLPSGLQYRVVKVGPGRTPADSDTVECKYRGTLSDGLEFINSARGDTSPVMRVDQAIAGLREALRLMPVGSRWIVFVPPALASGPPTATAAIPPNQVLIFDLELVSIK